MKVFLGCCEKSSEHILLDMIKALFQVDTQIEFFYQASTNLSPQLPKNCQAHLLFDSQLCAVMGFIEPLKRLPRLYERRQKLHSWIKEHRPELVIGIDAPDFWLPTEGFAKKLGLYSVHVVSPSVWAWRPGRVKTVAKSAHELYVLFDFEKPYYRQTELVIHSYPHPLVTAHLSYQNIQKNFKDPQAFSSKVLLLAPGSREKEVREHLPLFLEVAKNLLDSQKVDSVIVPVTRETHLQVLGLLNTSSGPYRNKIRVSSCLKESLSKSSWALAVSGTVVFECALFQVPTIVCYHISGWKKYLLSKIIKTPFICLPNILLGKPCFPEYIGSFDLLKKGALETFDYWLSTGENSSQSLEQVYKDLRIFVREVVQNREKLCLMQQLKSTALQALMKQGEAL